MNQSDNNNMTEQQKSHQYLPLDSIDFVHADENSEQNGEDNSNIFSDKGTVCLEPEGMKVMKMTSPCCQMVGVRMNQSDNNNMTEQQKSHQYPSLDSIDFIDADEKSEQDGEDNNNIFAEKGIFRLPKEQKDKSYTVSRRMVGFRINEIDYDEKSGQYEDSEDDASDDEDDDVKFTDRCIVGDRDEKPTLSFPDSIQPYPFNILDFLGVVASIILFVVDVVTDILLALEYKNQDRNVECVLTSSVVIASFLVAGSLSTIWYIQDGSGPKGRVKKILFLVLAFPFSTIIRNFSYLKHGYLSRRSRSTDKEKHYSRMIKNNMDASFLRMCDAFFESAPQLIIQVYIAIHDTPKEAIHLELLRAATIASSLAGLALSVAGYSKALHVFNATSDLKAFTHCGTVGYFLWRVFEIGPRITAIVMLISVEVYGPYLIIFGVMFHWMIMITVAFFKNVQAYKSKLHNVFFIVFIGFVKIISFMNLSRGRSRFLAIAYYSLFHVENVLMVVLFVVWGDVNKSSWVYIATISVALSGVIMCTLFMLTYYSLCHPKVSRSYTCTSKKDIEENGSISTISSDRDGSISSDRDRSISSDRDGSISSDRDGSISSDELVC
ncbi:XK-related protein 6-like [Saccostrea cucullata]|uniref:XK-related protein 6-like n=1 Tax=Saccostrea cuccullata TaxID=36930 RepID=UPI002ECFB426